MAPMLGPLSKETELSRSACMFIYNVNGRRATVLRYLLEGLVRRLWNRPQVTTCGPLCFSTQEIIPYMGSSGSAWSMQLKDCAFVRLAWHHVPLISYRGVLGFES
ncbi:hypothetical protein CHH75_16455 [Paenibacillus sp. 7541]|nr:hypothetical protein CHH75_16455 [Paenibacillus sp. 7541]